MSHDPKDSANQAPEAKSEELAPSEQEKISGGAPVKSPPPPPPPPKGLFEIEDYSFD